MRGPKPPVIHLADTERQELEVLTRCHATPQQLALRAHIQNPLQKREDPAYFMTMGTSDYATPLLVWALSHSIASRATTGQNASVLQGAVVANLVKHRNKAPHCALLAPHQE